MVQKKKRKRVIAIFLFSFVCIVAVFVISVIKTNTYNNTRHAEEFQGFELFSADAKEKRAVSVTAEPRDGTWTKLFDLKHEGIKVHNFRAYTYDFLISNNTKDEVAYFQFMLSFNQEVFIASAWNGALEIHQQVAGGEMVATIPDMRSFHPRDYALNSVTQDGDKLLHMEPGDYLVYLPSSTANAKEIPIAAHEGVSPGFILYMPIGKTLADTTVNLEYQFHRVLTSEPLFWVSVGALLIWGIVLIIVTITSSQIRKYQERHERDNEIIKGSIETFTSFIDAKDPYTNGHSLRVAEYTKKIAEEMGFSGEELDRIYYVALLHDCGKIGIPDSILGKPDRLTEEEFEIIKSHTICGGEILNHFKSLKNVGEGALYHHERYDGKGYPEGKKGEEIPRIARMICVADSYDVMMTGRVYQKKMTLKAVMKEIERNKGKQFDPEIAEVMLKLLREGKITDEY